MNFLVERTLREHLRCYKTTILLRRDIHPVHCTKRNFISLRPFTPRPEIHDGHGNLTARTAEEYVSPPLTRRCKKELVNDETYNE